MTNLTAVIRQDTAYLSFLTVGIINSSLNIIDYESTNLCNTFTNYIQFILVQFINSLNTILHT